jgi:hypothetical protein
MRLACFTIYTVVFELMVWGGWFWIVFVLNRSAWWTVLAIILSSSQLKLNNFAADAKEPA